MRFERLEMVAHVVVRRTLRNLPSEIRTALADCVIDLVLMSECRENEPDLNPDLLGLFEGCSRADPAPESASQLPRIRLFLDNLWDYAEGRMDTFRDEVRITLLHEIGHYLGLDEAQVARLGLA
jgi:predicted Zn-dependent protease with MMP-like domain